MKPIKNLTDLFPVSELQNLQHLFSEAMGFGTMIIDYKGNPVTKNEGIPDYCLKMQEDAGCMEKCLRSRAFGGVEAAKNGKPMLYICHAGLVILAVPIIFDGQYLGAVLSGQIRLSETETAELPVDSAVPLSSLNIQDEMRQFKEQIPIIPLERVKAAARLLSTLVNQLFDSRKLNEMQTAFNEQKKELALEVEERKKTEFALKQADLEVLQLQMNPHFMFNTLNMIGRLAMMEHAEKTQEVIYTFSDMMRYILKKEKTPFVSLKEELENVRNYLSIQKIRFRERLEYGFNIDSECEDLLCPFFIIQPLVENAVTYAIEPSMNGGSIIISAHLEKEILVISVCDDGKDSDNHMWKAVALKKQSQECSAEKGFGLGLSNVNERIQYHFGSAYGVSVNEEKARGTEVMIKIPIIHHSGRRQNV